MIRYGALLLALLAPSLALAETVTICGDEVSRDVERLSIFEETCRPADWAKVAALPRLRSLVLSENKSVTNRVLAQLRDIETLEYLSLSKTSITNSGLVHVGTLTNLRHLVMDHNDELTGLGLRHLTKLQRLERLQPSLDQLTDVGAAYLAKMPALDSIVLHPEDCEEGECDYCIDETGCVDLRGSSITSVGLNRLSSLPIRTLMIWPWRVDDQTLASLARFGSLRSFNCAPAPEGEDTVCVNLSESSVTLVGLNALKVRRVDHLRVPGALLTPDGLKAAQKIPGLRSINCDRCLPSPYGSSAICGGVEYFDDCVDLTGGSSFGLEVLDVVTGFEGVRRLVLPERFTYSGEAASLIFSMSELRQINSDDEGVFDLSEAVVTGSALRELRQARHVRALLLPEMTFPDDAVSSIEAVPSLERLSLPRGTISHRAVEALLKIDRLRELTVPPEAISARALTSAVSRPSLRALNVDLSECLERCGELFPRCYNDEFCAADRDRVCGEACASDDLRLDLSGTSHLRRALRLLEAAPDRGARLFVEEPDDRVVAAVAANEGVSSLNCVLPSCVDTREGSVTLKGIRHLPRVTELETLMVSRELVSDELMVVLGRQKKLRSLNPFAPTVPTVNLAGREEISLGALGHLKNLTRLKSVWLGRPLDDATLAVLSEIPALESVNCRARVKGSYRRHLCVEFMSEVSRPGAAALSKISHLRALLIPSSMIDDELLIQLVNETSLDSLNCAETAITIYTSPVATLVPRCFDLRGSKVTARGLASLKGRPIELVAPPESISPDEVRALLPGIEILEDEDSEMEKGR